MENINTLVPYALLVLVVVLFALKDKTNFESLVKGVIARIEKELKDSIGGHEKMETVVLEVIDLLPAQIKMVLKVIAAITGKTLEELVHSLCQRVYDSIFATP